MLSGYLSHHHGTRRFFSFCVGSSRVVSVCSFCTSGGVLCAVVSSAVVSSAVVSSVKVGSQIGIALRRECDYDAFNLHLADGTAAGQVVNHAHLHVVPRGVEDGFYWNWRQLKYEDGEAQAIADKIKERLAKKL